MATLFTVSYKDEYGHKAPTWGYWSWDVANDSIQMMIDEHPLEYNLENLVIDELPVEELHAHTVRTLSMNGLKPKSFLDIRQELGLPQNVTAEQLLLNLLTDPLDNILRWLVDLSHDTKAMKRLGLVEEVE